MKLLIFYPTEKEAYKLSMMNYDKQDIYIFNPACSGEHVPVVERKIETIKERVRSYLQSLRLTLMYSPSLLRYLVDIVLL